VFEDRTSLSSSGGKIVFKGSWFVVVRA